ALNAPWPRGRALAHLQCGTALMPGILTVAEAARRIAVKQLSPRGTDDIASRPYPPARSEVERVSAGHRGTSPRRCSGRGSAPGDRRVTRQAGREPYRGLPGMARRPIASAPDSAAFLRQ